MGKDTLILSSRAPTCRGAVVYQGCKTLIYVVARNLVEKRNSVAFGLTCRLYIAAVVGSGDVENQAYPGVNHP